MHSSPTIRAATWIGALFTLLLTLGQAGAKSYQWSDSAPFPGSWSVAANWNPSGPPQDGDDVSIVGSGSAAFLDTKVSLNSLTLANGAQLRVGKDLLVTGELDLQVSTLAGGGGAVTVGGLMHVDPFPPSFNQSFLACPLTNNGTVIVNGGAVLQYSAPVTLQNNGTFTMADQATLNFGLNNGGQLVNGKLFTAGNSLISGGNEKARFTTTAGGTVSAPAGRTLQITTSARVACSGTFNADKNGRIDINAPTAFHDGARLTGSGIILLRSANNLADGAVTVADTLQLGDDQGGAGWNEQGTLTIEFLGALSWYGGTIQGPGPDNPGIIVNDGVVACHGNAAPNLFSTILTNHNTLLLNARQPLSMGYGAQIVNDTANSHFSALVGSAIAPLSSGTPGYDHASILNQGGAEFISTVGTNEIFFVKVPFYNDSGHVKAPQGTLIFDAGGSLGDTLSGGIGSAQVQYRGGHFSVPSAGASLRTRDSTILLNGAIFDLTGGAGITVQNSTVQQSAGKIQGIGTLEVVRGNFLWTGGSLAISNGLTAAVAVDAGASLTVQGPDYKPLTGGPLVNRGTVTLVHNAGGNETSSILAGDGVAIDNHGTFNFAAPAGLTDASTGVHPVFTNETDGVVIKSDDSTSRIGFRLRNLGLIRAQAGILDLAALDGSGETAQVISLESGTLNLEQPTSIGGKLRGNGKIVVSGTVTNEDDWQVGELPVSGDAANAGKLTLGDPPGPARPPNSRSGARPAGIPVTSAPLGRFAPFHFTQSAAGRLVVPVVGTNAAAGEFGRVQAGGTATLDGALEVVIQDGYAPPPGATFPFLTANRRVGTFSSVTLPAGFTLSYGLSGATLVVTGPVPVQILPPAVVAGQFQFGFNTINGRAYSVEYADDLTAGGWTPYTNFIGDGSGLQLSLPPPPPLLPRRFFRVIEP